MLLPIHRFKERRHGNKKGPERRFWGLRLITLFGCGYISGPWPQMRLRFGDIAERRIPAGEGFSIHRNQ
jgi:hypothetical protein